MFIYMIRRDKFLFAYFLFFISKNNKNDMKFAFDELLLMITEQRFKNIKDKYVKQLAINVCHLYLGSDYLRSFDKRMIIKFLEQIENE